MVIDGKEIAKQLRDSLIHGVSEFKTLHGNCPSLTVVLVGHDPASQVYVRNKIKQTQEIGMISNEIRLPESTTETELLSVLQKLNKDDLVHGILVQLPLPKTINEHNIIAAINPDKDVDGFHAINSGRLLNGETGALVPCTPQGCVILAKSYLGDDLSGKHVVVIGRSNIVGKPVSLLFLQENCTVTMTHSKTKNLATITQQADIVIAAVGCPNMITGDFIKPGATVIDVGINRITDKQGNIRLVGDVDFASAVSVAAAITPVPGGVGPMTIACLLKNTMQAARNQQSTIKNQQNS